MFRPMLLAGAFAAVIGGPALAGGTDWTGLYLGVQGGGAWSDGTSSYDNPNPGSLFGQGLVYYGIGDTDFDSSGFTGGFTAGYNFQLSPDIVLGVEGDLSFGRVSGREADVYGNLRDGSTADYIQSSSDWSATLRARAGYSFGSALVYVTGGVAWTDVDVYSRDYSDSSNTTYSELRDSASLFGAVFGAGMEYRFTARLSGKIEYLHAAFGDHTYFSGADWQSTSSSSSDSLRVGLNFHF